MSGLIENKHLSRIQCCQNQLLCNDIYMRHTAVKITKQIKTKQQQYCVAWKLQ